jgi:transmembrane sensor
MWAHMTLSDEPDRLIVAAAWRSRLTNAPDHIFVELQAWLLQDPRNEAAWRQVQGPYDLLGEHASAPAVLRHRRAALEYAYRAARTQSRPARPYLAALVGAAALLVVGLAGWILWRDTWYQVYQTRAGERRVITLSDGSQVALDSQSEVKVHYGADSRQLTLVTGQARFDVAHDVTRPFSVVARGQQVIATGTAFNVDLMGADLLVTLIEGHVTVLPQASPAPALTKVLPFGSQAPLLDRIALDAGEQLVLSPAAKPKITRVNIERTTAWEAGQLVFEDEPLKSVVARVSRYGPRKIVVAAEDSASELRISGVFREGDVDGFLSTVTSYLPLAAQQLEDGTVRVQHR